MQQTALSVTPSTDDTIMSLRCASSFDILDFHRRDETRPIHWRRIHMLKSNFTNTQTHRVVLVLLAAFLLASAGQAGEKPKDAFYWNGRLGRTINVPGTFSFRKRLWVLSGEHLGKIKDAGFTAVRVPVGWQWHVESDAPYRIDSAFLAEVDQGLRWGLDNGLVMVLDFHAGLQFGDFSDAGNSSLFPAVWKQLAEHYRDGPEALLFEILNEPRGMSMEDWNTWQNEVITIIRDTNPGRTLIVGSIQYNKAEYLATLKLPEQDRNLIATWHLYVPYQFCAARDHLANDG